MEDSAQEALTIEKSKALVWAKFSNYTAGEMRLLEVYLSKIDARDPESALVTFTLGEYKQITGLAKAHAASIRQQLSHFVGQSVSIDRHKLKSNGEETEDFRVISLFKYADYEYDEDTKQYLVKIRCNDMLDKAFFSLSDSGYIKYRLRYTVNMKSQYSIQLYSMLRDMQHIEGGWDIKVQKLREQLGIAEGLYSDIRDFRKGVLDRAIREINDVSDLRVTMTPLKQGRNIIGFHFDTVIVNPEQDRTEEEKQRLLEHDGRWYQTAIHGKANPTQAIRLAGMLREQITQAYPHLQGDELDCAVYDTLDNASRAVNNYRAEDAPFIENYTGYLWTVFRDNPDAIREYLPAKYVYDIL